MAKTKEGFSSQGVLKDEVDRPQSVTFYNAILEIKNLSFFQRVMNGINKSTLLDFKLKESHVIKTAETDKHHKYLKVTLSASQPVDFDFFSPLGPVWSTVRSLESMKICWNHKITDDDVTLMFGLAIKGVNVDNEVSVQYQKRVPFDILQQRLKELAQPPATPK